MQVVLVMFRNDGERRSFSVVRNMTVIGRREDCDLRIPVGDVSRKHCRLVLTDDGVRIEDLGSSNGTHVNGQRVQESDLNPGDVVGIGPVQFIVQIDGVPDDDVMAPPAQRPARHPDDSSIADQPVPQEEMTMDQAGLEELPAGEVEAEQEPATEEPTIDEATLGETPAEEAAADELPPLEEAPVAPAPPPPPLSPVPQLYSDAPVPKEVPTELEAAEEPLEDLEELVEPEAIAEHEPAAPVAAAEPVEKIAEKTGLEETTPAAEEIEPVDLEAAGESEWDFVVEESDDNRSPQDFKLDLDSPHEQPH